LLKYDLNKDGKLDDQERAIAQETERRDNLKGAAKEEFEAKMLKKYDTNGDGKLDSSERAASNDPALADNPALAKANARFDSDGDGA